MKLLLILMLVGSSAYAGTWDVISGFTKKSIDPVAYELSTSGANLRVYEWETPTGKVCTSVISSKGIAVDCDWKKDQQ